MSMLKLIVLLLISPVIVISNDVIVVDKVDMLSDINVESRILSFADIHNTEKNENSSKKIISRKEFKEEISIDNLKNNLEQLCKTPRKRGTDENKIAGEFIKDKLEGMGYKAEFQYFDIYNISVVDSVGEITKENIKPVDGEVLGKYWSK